MGQIQQPKDEVVGKPFASFPATGVVGKIYVDTSTSPATLYIWNGSTYEEVGGSASAGLLTYMFINTASDIATYKTAIALNSYSAGALGDISTAGVSTTPTLLGTFATQLGFPNVTIIPIGTFTVHYDTEKVAGSNNYYTYAAIYKRTAGGAETLIATTDNSTQSAVNTQLSTTVTAANLADITLLSTDRLVVKIYGVMVSSTATIHLYYDDSTSARIELPSSTVDATNFLPYTGATQDTNLGSKSLTTTGGVVGGNLTSSAMTPGSALFAGAAGLISQNNQNFYYDNVLSRLSVFGGLGSEMTTNGSFTGSATGWTVGAGFAYSSNSVSHTSNGTATLTQSISAQSYREYLLVFTISALTVGTVTPSIGGVSGDAISANGTYTVHIATANNATAFLAFTPSNTARFTIDTISVKPLQSGRINTGNLNIDGSWSNGGPGTTNAMSFNNAGGNTWSDYRFAGVLRATIGVNSSGGFDMYASGGNYFGFYYGNSGLTSTSLFAYLYPTAFVHGSGYGAFGTGVIAGAGYAPSSTLQSVGGMAAGASKHITTGQALDNTASKWFLDASVATCIGTPSVSTCSSYTGSGQAICESHLPCSWYAGDSCSAFNGEYGMGTCSGTSGCSADTNSCSGAGDESSCYNQNSSYGGSCAWSGTDCSGLDEGTCGSTSGCSVNTSDCSSFNGNESGCSGTSGCSVSSSNTCPSQGDESSCTGAGCSWDGMSCTGDNSTCSGTYFTGCTGTYYSCTGTYYTGNCSGTYGAACQGTVSCSSYGTQIPCEAETGCAWSTAITVTLPSILTCPGRDYWLCNANSSSNDAIATPYAGDTIDMTSSYTIGTYKQCIHITNHVRSDSCNGFNEGACTPTGCTKTYGTCSWDSMDGTCSGNAVCVGIGDQTTCEATTYFLSCDGNYYTYKNWWIIGNV